MPQPIEALRSLGSHPSVQLDSLQRRRQAELEERLARATATGPTPGLPGELSALQQMLRSVGSDIEENTVSQQAPIIEAAGAANRAANQQGFGTPQEQAAYGRSEAELQRRIPLQQAEIQADTARRQMRSVADTTRYTTDANIGAQRDASKAYYDHLASLQNQPGTGAPLTGFTAPNKSGGGSARFATPTAIPGQLDSNLMRSRMSVTQAREQYGESSPQYMSAVDAHNQAVASIYARLPGSVELKDMADFIASHPEMSQMRADEVLSHPELNSMYDVSGITPEELQQLDVLLNYGRGRPRGGS